MQQIAIRLTKLRTRLSVKIRFTTFLGIALFSTSGLCSSQIPEPIENDENLDRGRNIIAQARARVYADSEFSDIEELEYSLQGESIETNRFGTEKTGKTATAHFSHDDLIILNRPDKFEIQMAAKLIGGLSTKIVHQTEGEVAEISTPDVRDAKAYNDWGEDYLSSMPFFNKSNDRWGKRHWIFLFPMLMRINFTDEDSTKYIFVGKAESPHGVADIISTSRTGKIPALLFFDETSHLLLKLIIKRSFGNTIAYYSDYRETDGMMIPHKINIEEVFQFSDALVGDRMTKTIREMKLKDFSIKTKSKL